MFFLIIVPQNGKWAVISQLLNVFEKQKSVIGKQDKACLWSSEKTLFNKLQYGRKSSMA